ncbi:MAG: AAA family ATPase [Candidatus Buchananbacteria bacterium]|nr:AAA family ATPase [Candidatus Buchananbacteria bacterium]
MLRLLRWAMVQRQHLLVFGDPGTAKTAVCDRVYEGIYDAEKFHIELAMFMGDDAVFGPYDIRKMKEDGILEHRTEGMLPEADLARLGEFLDGSMPLLRSLLSSLNERRLRRGTQIVDMPLVTVFCDTNKHPGEFLKKNSYAWAVLDRLLFITEVKYLETDDELFRMVRSFQNCQGVDVKDRIPLDLIHNLSELVVAPPTLIRDELIMIKYAQAAREYRERRREAIKSNDWKVILPEVSDRRIAIASQMLEVSAVLDGRLYVEPSDLLNVADALGSTPEEHDLWREIAEGKIEEIHAEKMQQLDHAQKVAINSIMEQADRVDLHGDVKLAVGDLKVLQQSLGDVVPENDDVAEFKERAATKVSEMIEQLRQRALAEAGLHS